MTTASSGAQAPAAETSFEQRWRVALVAAVLVCLAYALIPRDSVAVDTILYAGLEALAGVAIIIGIRLHRPNAPTAWWALAAALFSWMVADVIWGFYQAADKDPFPSWADPFYLLGYALIGVAFAIAARARATRIDLRSLIDPAIVCVAVGFAAWVFQISPAIEDPATDGISKFVAVMYPICDLLLAGIAARLIFGARWGDLSLILLVIGLGMILAGDLQYASAPEEAVYALVFADTLLLGGAAAIGLAGLHPTMTALTAPRRGPDDPDENLAARLVGVAFTGLIVPIVVVIQHYRGDAVDLAAALITATTLGGLLVLRYAYSAARARKAAQQERTLSRFAGELLQGGERDTLDAVAAQAASELIGGGKTTIVAPDDPSVSAEESFAVPVMVAGEEDSVLVVERRDAEFLDTQAALGAVAAQLSMAVERQRLLAREQEATRVLNEQMERLRELDVMKNQLVSSVSHELRTPLTSIVGFLELLVDGEAGELSEDQEHFLGIIGRNCDRLTRLVDDILFVARVDAGRLSLDLQDIDIVDVVAKTVESARPVAARKDLTLKFDAETDTLVLHADPVRIGELLDNLTSNAIKFTPEGGVVTVVVASDDGILHLEVRDTGVGIPPDEVEKLFERFFRASTSSVAAGTGLGLSITKSIVEAHRGKIWVESTLGEGTTFLVDLPLRVPPAAAAAGKSDEIESA